MNPLWPRQEPAGLPTQVRTDTHASLVALLGESLVRHRNRAAFICMGRALSYGQLDEHALALAAWLQAQGLARGDRVALLPNVLRCLWPRWRAARCPCARCWWPGRQINGAVPSPAPWRRASARR